jgi:hypothetical protein
VIKVGPDGIQDLLGKKRKKPSSENDDDDANEEDKPKFAVIDLSGKSKEERKQILAKFVDNVLRDAGLSASEREDQAIKFSAIDANVSTSSSADEKDDLRQKCIATLRKLSESGQLSPAQKRVLFTDIITSSARGESSMVETAYELLCTGSGVGENGLVGLEDFTEQCRVFATAYEQEK